MAKHCTNKAFIRIRAPFQMCTWLLTKCLLGLMCKRGAMSPPVDSQNKVKHANSPAKRTSNFKGLSEYSYKQLQEQTNYELASVTKLPRQALPRVRKRQHCTDKGLARIHAMLLYFDPWLWKMSGSENGFQCRNYFVARYGINLLLLLYNRLRQSYEL